MAAELEKSSSFPELDTLRQRYAVELVQKIAAESQVSVEAFDAIFSHVRDAVRQLGNNHHLRGREIEQVEADRFADPIAESLRHRLARLDVRMNDDLLRATRATFRNLVCAAVIAHSNTYQRQRKRFQNRESEKNDPIDLILMKALRDHNGYRAKVSTLVDRRLKAVGINTNARLRRFFEMVRHVLKEEPQKIDRPVKPRFQKFYRGLDLPFSYPTYGITREEFRLIRHYLEELFGEEIESMPWDDQR